MNTRLLFVHALSPLHAGTGQSVGAVDLTIARDRATGHPYLPGSSLKGSLRSKAFEQTEKNDRKTTAMFGPESNEMDSNNQHAGAMAFGDANLLALPVRSIKGTFAWITSPILLARFARDAKEVGNKKLPALPHLNQVGECYLGKDSVLAQGNKVYFEDLDLDPKSNDATTSWAEFIAKLVFTDDEDWQKMFAERFCVVNDDVMSFFSKHGTDVVTRIKIDDDSKTVADGQLWTEESLPAESILCALVMATPNKGAKNRWGEGFSTDAMFAKLQNHARGSVQFGGKATVGRGRCRLVVAGGAQ